MGFSSARKKMIKFGRILAAVFLATCVYSCAVFQPAPVYRYIDHKVTDTTLTIKTDSAEVVFNGIADNSLEILYQLKGQKSLPSFAKDESLQLQTILVEDNPNSIKLVNGELTAIIDKYDLSVDYYRNTQKLTRQNEFNRSNERLQFGFSMTASEKMIGGGQRVLGMNRRGHRMPLYNRAHYGYTTESNQMYYSLPVVMSDKKYAVIFDNSASGHLDIGKTQQDILSFEAVSGRASYMITAADSFPDLIHQYVSVTGKQPLPPRWALGNFASRFGYKTEAEVRQTVDNYFDEDFPLDAIILDLYWFGPDIKGHMGNLAWDHNAFANPEQMIADLKDKGVKTILVTEPFVLSTSKRWQEAVDNRVLAKDSQGEVKRFDFYFGNTGLIDVFDQKAQDWFWGIYQDLFNQGVAGTWGDLGEPEVHPDDALHYLSETRQTARGDEVHNAFGHQWAKLVYENQQLLQPNVRPFIMMRSGFVGSQRFGMIPWTGDVSRSWGGLKPQVELSLQMGLLGLAYTHSDLGGFAGGEVFDREMYIRWLQFGVFQPVYRPHAQDNIAPEPVFHDQLTKDVTREFIKLRYRLMPYHYTMAYQNSMTGMPLMRPIFFTDESNSALFDIKDSYLWGDAFLVSPVTEAGITDQNLYLPKGVWFDYWTDKKYVGSQKVDIPVTLNTIPVLVKAGAFIPMTADIKTSEEYSSESLELHYYADESITESNGEMYEDDGQSADALSSQAYDLLQFKSSQNDSRLIIDFSKKGKSYTQAPKSRNIKLLIHNWQQAPSQIKVDSLLLGHSAYQYDSKKKLLTVNFDWQSSWLQLEIE